MTFVPTSEPSDPFYSLLFPKNGVPMGVLMGVLIPLPKAAIPFLLGVFANPPYPPEVRNPRTPPSWGSGAGSKPSKRTCARFHRGALHMACSLPAVRGVGGRDGGRGRQQTRPHKQKVSYERL